MSHVTIDGRDVDLDKLSERNGIAAGITEGIMLRPSAMR
jgi:hypothetical protein